MSKTSLIAPSNVHTTPQIQDQSSIEGRQCCDFTVLALGIIVGLTVILMATVGPWKGLGTISVLAMVVGALLTTVCLAVITCIKCRSRPNNVTIPSQAYTPAPTDEGQLPANQQIKPEPSPVTSIINTGSPISNISLIQLDNPKYADELLQQYHGDDIVVFTDKNDKEVEQPRDERIGRLMSICLDILEPKLVQELEQFKNESTRWGQPSVITAANALLEASYVLGCLALIEFNQREKEANSAVRKIEILTSKGAYYYACMMFPRSYRYVRGDAFWDERQGSHLNTTNEYKRLFSKINTPQNAWRKLFNHYGDRVNKAMTRNVIIDPCWKVCSLAVETKTDDNDTESIQA